MIITLAEDNRLTSISENPETNSDIAFIARILLTAVIAVEDHRDQPVHSQN